MVVMHQTQLPLPLQPFGCTDLVRLGKRHDGGYLVNAQDVVKTQHLVSLGIGDDWSFERDFAQLSQCSITAYDENASDHADFHEFFQPPHRTHHGTNICSPLQFPNLNPQTFVKCDIEGGEYALMDCLIEQSFKITGCVVEFHHLNYQDNWMKLVDFVSKIKCRLAHVHINNWFYYKTPQGSVPDVLEVTLSSGDNLILDRNLTLPHIKDMPNNPHEPQFAVRWLSSINYE
jgi:hypothetical protein